MSRSHSPPYLADMFRLLSTFLLIGSFHLGAQSDLLTNARSVLTDVDPDVRIAALDSLLATGRVSPELYLALGNAYHADERPGQAILHYERGLRLAPGNRDLANNLRFVRGDAGINELQVRSFFLTNWWRAVGAFLGASFSQWLALVFWALAVGGAAYWFLRRRQMDEKRRFALLPLAAIALVLAGLFYSLGSSRAAYLSNDREAVLVARAATLRVAPGPDASPEADLSEGVKLRVLDEFDGYVKVALENGQQGYVPEETVERI